MIGDGLKSNAGGALRGLGEQRLLLLMNIIGFWVLAIPSGALLTFVAKMGVSGLWWGMIIGVYSAAFLGIYLLRVYIYWDKAADMAKHRISIVTQDPHSSDDEE